MREHDEDTASKETRAVFTRLRSIFGYASIPLLWRTLASEPDALHWASALVLDRAGIVHRISADLAHNREDARLPDGTLAGLGISTETCRDVRTMIAGFQHANPINLTMACLLDSAAREGVAPQVDKVTHHPPPSIILPPVPDIGALDARERRLVAWLTTCGGRRKTDAVPTLYRYLAQWPDALAVSAIRLSPVFSGGTLADAASALTVAVQTNLMQLPSTVVADCPAPSIVLATTREFQRLIPEMILIGDILATMFTERGE